MEDVVSDTLLMSRYSTSSLTVANAYGVIGRLKELEALKQREDQAGGDDRVRLERLLKEEEVDRILDLAALELETLTNYIDCRVLQLDKIRTRLGESNDKRSRTLTNYAVIAGALSAILVAGILLSRREDLNQGDAKDWIGVGGGLAAAYLAVRSAQVNRTVAIRHENNLVEAVWTGKNDSGVFSDSTWYLLNESHRSDDKELSIRESIVEEWMNSPTMLGNKTNHARLPELLGDTGTYDQTLLALRLDMLEDIEGGVDRARLSLFRLNMEINQ